MRKFRPHTETSTQPCFDYFKCTIKKSAKSRITYGYLGQTNKHAVWHACESYDMHFQRFGIHNPSDVWPDAMRKLTTVLSAQILHVRKSLLPPFTLVDCFAQSMLLCGTQAICFEIGVQELEYRCGSIFHARTLIVNRC